MNPTLWLAAAALGVCAVLTWRTYPIRLFLLMALGRSWCPLREAWTAPRHRAIRLRLKAELAKTARVLREDGDAVLWEIAGERYWLPRGSRILPGMLAEQKLGSYESAGHGVRRGDVVLDCGASIGLYTLHALALGASHVVAIEPSPRNLECLRRNLAGVVREGRATIVAKGVWDKDDALTLRMQPENSAADSVALAYRGSRDGPKVPVTTIDAIVRELGLTRVDYIKMDTEGAERAALRGAAQTLRRFHPRLTIAMEHRFDDPREIPKLVASIADGYRVERGPCVDAGNALRPAIMDFY
ncbi:MAG: FkbM family methyltransferase [Verrucomicrobiae bacterium]|nr:FkbM family methyltransferase [Verrucomicrobiae bacterium]